jgi:ribosome-binding factor A
MTRNLPYDRSDRVAEQIMRLIASACCTSLSDPRLEGLEITRVRMTKDLQTARVYYHLRRIDKQMIESAKKGLESARGFFKRIIKEEMKLRYIPDIEFFYDEVVDLEEKIDRLMTKKE